MAKGKSAGAGKRVKKVLKANASSVSQGSIRRLARRGGVGAGADDANDFVDVGDGDGEAEHEQPHRPGEGNSDRRVEPRPTLGGWRGTDIGGEDAHADQLPRQNDDAEEHPHPHRLAQPLPPGIRASAPPAAFRLARAAARALVGAAGSRGAADPAGRGMRRGCAHAGER